MSWAKFAIPIVGTFIGAGLAFLSNLYLQRRIRKQDNMASGYLALLTLRSQLDDFLNYRWAVRGGLAKASETRQGAPAWALLQPVGFNFNEGNLFEFKSLAFLLATEAGRGAFQQLQAIQRMYLDLTARHDDLDNSVQEAQQRLATCEADGENRSWDAVEKYLGPELIARVCSQLQNIVIRFDRDEDRYFEAFDMLNAVIGENFGGKVKLPRATIPEKYKKAGLPPLPTSLRNFLDLVVGEENSVI